MTRNAVGADWRVQFREHGCVLQKRPAVGDAGERIDHRGLAVTQLRTLLRHRKQEECAGDGEQQRLEAQHRHPDASVNAVAAEAGGSSAIIGVRSRNSAPCAKNMTIAGQRETSASLRPRQNSNAVSQT